MPLAQTLQKVDGDIRQGDLGKAVSRLHGLIGSYPNDLALREKLAAVYWRLQLPGLAGRYWYLVEAKDERMQSACQNFETQFRKDPMRILLALKFKGDFAAIQDAYAGRVLADLERRAGEKYAWFPSFRKKALSRYSRPEKRGVTQRVRDFFFQWGCVVALALVAALALVGLFTAASALLRLLQ